MNTEQTNDIWNLTPLEALTQLRGDFLFQPRSGKVENATAWPLLEKVEQALQEGFQDRREVEALRKQLESFRLFERVIHFLRQEGSIEIPKQVDRELLDVVLSQCPV
jgi:hypothetical protein